MPRMIFLGLATLVAILAIGLTAISHVDMAQMRTPRSGFDLDGLATVLSGMAIAAGMVFLFPLWRLLAFDKALAQRDLTVWMAALWAVLIGLHLPYVLSVCVEQTLQRSNVDTIWQGFMSYWQVSEGLVLLLAMLWPLAAIIGIQRYRAYLSQSMAKPA